MSSCSLVGILYAPANSNNPLISIIQAAEAKAEKEATEAALAEKKASKKAAEASKNAAMEAALREADEIDWE